MQVVKAAGAERGIECVHGACSQRAAVFKPHALCQKIRRNHSQRHNRRLSELKRYRRRNEHVKREQKIIYRRDVHRKVAHQRIPLACDKRKSGLAHVVKHVYKQPEIKVWRGKVLVAHHRDHRDKRKHHQSKHSRAYGRRHAAAVQKEPDFCRRAADKPPVFFYKVCQNEQDKHYAR